MEEINTLVSAAATGDRLTLLKEIRQKLAESLERTESGRDVAALSKQLRETAEEIDALENTSTEADNTPVSVLSIIRARHTA